MRWAMTRKISPSAIAAILALAVVAILLAGCGSTNGVQTTSSASANQPVEGGTLRVGMEAEPGSLDPAREWSSAGMTIERSLFDTLVAFRRVGGDAGLQLVPDLASSMPTVSPDGLHYVFHLRRDVKFAPPVNRVVTANDVKASFERMMRTPAAPTSYYTPIKGAQAFVDGKASHIVGLQVLDGSTLAIDLQKRDPELLLALTESFASVVPIEYYEAHSKEVGQHPIGTGPFVLSGWRPGQAIELKRNTNYAGPFPVYVDNIDVSFVSATIGVLRVQKDQLDIIGDQIPSPDIVRLSADSTWKNQLTISPDMGLFFMFMNTQVKPFDNLGVRRALMWAINRDKLVKLQTGVAWSLDQLLPPGVAGYEKGLGAPYTGYDAQKAKQLLAQAGYPNGFTTTLTCWNQDPLPKLMQSIQYDLSAIGIKANIKLLNQSNYFTMVGKPGEISLGIMGWVADFPDPSNFLPPLFTKAGIGGYNGSFYSSPHTEALVAAAENTLDPAKRASTYAEVQRSILDQAATVPLWQVGSTYVVNKSVGGFYVHPIILLDMLSYWKR